MIASGLPGRRLTASFVSPALSQCQLAAASPKYYRLHVCGARSPPVKSLSQKPGLVGQCLTNVLRKVAESAPDEICRHASFAAQRSKASFSPVAKCNRMCFKEPRCRKNKRHDILKSSTENIQQAGFYCPLLFAFWPLVTMQDYIPFFPIWILALACPLVGIAEWMSQKIALPVFLLPALLVSVELVWMVHGHPPLKQTNQRNLKVISDALNLTDRGETVFDSRGQAIFRPRPYYYVFEQITRERVGRGELPDDAPARPVAARTPVAVPAYWLTTATRQFMDQNYISLGSVLVLGKRIFPPPDGHVQFEVVIPEKYTLVGKSGPLSGTLDGANLNGPHDLSAGVHQLILKSPGDVVAVVWSRAIEKAYSPFEPTKKQR
jgi:hypothetical protein